MSRLAVLLVVSFTVTVNAFSKPDLDALAEFCGKESNKRYCDMIAVLAARKTSEAYEYPQGEAEGEAESNYPGQMEKRKPSFVRFGKRSSSDYPLVLNQEELQMNKRKPSFVRFGRK